MLGMYIHVPFCEKICDYCDFRVMPAIPKLYSEYVDLLIREIRYFSKVNPCALKNVETLYIGGGTPSVLPSSCLRRIFTSLQELGVDISNLKEISMEFNPESCNETTVSVAQECGVGRFSLGLQSFHPDILKRVGRRHSVKDAFHALEYLCSKPNIEVSGDLMFNLPGQHVGEFLEDLLILCDFPLNHISFYGLTVSERTRLGHKLACGELSIDESLYEEMYLRGVDLIFSKGFTRYEVSNFCRSQKIGIHNSNYWNRGEYLGFGPGAHAFYKGVRSYAPEIYPRWKDFVLKNMPKSEIVFDELTSKDIWTERVWLSLRQSSGLDLESLQNDGIHLPYACYQKWVEKGYLTKTNGRLKLVGRGWVFMDSIVTDILNGYNPN